jgi:hypothetical protein
MSAEPPVRQPKINLIATVRKARRSAYAIVEELDVVAFLPLLILAIPGFLTPIGFMAVWYDQAGVADSIEVPGAIASQLIVATPLTLAGILELKSLRRRALILLAAGVFIAVLFAAGSAALAGAGWLTVVLWTIVALICDLFGAISLIVLLPWRIPGGEAN